MVYSYWRKPEGRKTHKHVTTEDGLNKSLLEHLKRRNHSIWWCSLFPIAVLVAGDRSARASAPGCRPTHDAPDPCDASCGWWACRTMGLCAYVFRAMPSWAQWTKAWPPDARPFFFFFCSNYNSKGKITELKDKKESSDNNQIYQILTGI